MRFLIPLILILLASLSGQDNFLSFTIQIRDAAVYQFWILAECPHYTTLQLKIDRVDQGKFVLNRSPAPEWVKKAIPVEVSEGSHEIHLVGQQAGIKVQRIWLSPTVDPTQNPDRLSPSSPLGPALFEESEETKDFLIEAYLMKTLAWIKQDKIATLVATHSQRILPSQDAFVDNNQPEQLFGKSEELQIEVNTRSAELLEGQEPLHKSAYLQYKIPESSDKVVGGLLHLFSLKEGGGGKIWGLTPTEAQDLSEATLNWKNRPGSTGMLLDRFEGTVRGRWLILDVSAGLLGNPKFFSVGLIGDEGSSLTFSAREGYYPPFLEIIYEKNKAVPFEVIRLTPRSLQTLELYFNQEIDSLTVMNIKNFSITPAVAIQGVRRGEDRRSVFLETGHPVTLAAQKFKLHTQYKLVQKDIPFYPLENYLVEKEGDKNLLYTFYKQSLSYDPEDSAKVVNLFLLGVQEREAGSLSKAMDIFKFLEKSIYPDWQQSSIGENWIVSRYGQCPKPYLNSNMAVDSLEIDGQLSERSWKMATPISDFILENLASQKAKVQTQVFSTHDRQTIYLGIINYDPLSILFQTESQDLNSDIQNEDHVQIGLDPSRGYQDMDVYYISASNSKKEKSKKKAATENWQAAVYIGKNYWSVEAAFSLKKFELEKFKDGVMNFNVRRVRYSGTSPETSLWCAEQPSTFHSEKSGYLLIHP